MDLKRSRDPRAEDISEQVDRARAGWILPRSLGAYLGPLAPRVELGTPTANSSLAPSFFSFLAFPASACFA